MGYAAQRALNRRPGLQRGVSVVAGVAMIVVGLGLLGEQVVHLIHPA